jgi:glycosyltransferase involved in cell wall biosynthesis
MKFTVVLSSYTNDLNFLPRSLGCLKYQEHEDYEVIVTIKASKVLYDRAVSDCFSKGKWVQAIPFIHCQDNSTGGNRERALALTQAKGDYITWLSADNVMFPNWLSTHNSQIKPNCISIVNTHHWSPAGYAGILPSDLAYGCVDLINFSLPVSLARSIDAFGKGDELDMSSDWAVLSRAILHKQGEVIWDRTRMPVGCHF